MDLSCCCISVRVLYIITTLVIVAGSFALMMTGSVCMATHNYSACVDENSAIAMVVIGTVVFAAACCCTCKLTLTSRGSRALV